MTEKDIKKLKSKSKRYSVNCGESLYLRVSPTGFKSWVLRYYQAQKVRDITLGRWPDLTLLQAKQAAHFKREELKIKPSVGLTFTDGYKLWQRKKKGHIVSYTDECQRIEKHLLPYLKKLQLEDVTAPVVLNVLLKIEDKLPTLKRCLMRVNEILELCVCAGLLNSNPCRKLSRIFSTHQAINRPFIPANELYKLFYEIKDCQDWFKCYVLFAVYSLLRPIECSSLQWSWIQDDVLILPAEIMKKRRVHRVPLCPEILKLLQHVKTLRKVRLNKFVWAFGRNRQAINKQHLTKWLSTTSLKGKLCHHGLRATGRTWMRDNNVIYEVAEDALAHLTGTATERAYLRGDYLEQRRAVMQAWWNFIYKQYCAVCAPLRSINSLDMR
ncbi:MAG: integrase arm-type DNA-binding domain-containing protein [Succinatimonas sp.]|nr:integrase arm-type DNA-binding domain-containing protein [Succinatimonas sp.]